MRIKVFVIIALFLASLQGVAQQDKDFKVEKEQLYTDYVADEFGNRLYGITVRIRGKSGFTQTNYNGEFTINASYGDEIILSKDGKIINTYIYDGRMHYEVEDKSNFKISKSVSYSNQFKKFIDSANYFIKTDPFKSISFVENALKSVKTKRGNSSKLATAYGILGDVYMHLNQYDLAEINYLTSVENKSADEVKFKLARAYAQNNNIERSNSILNELIKDKNTDEHLIELYSELGSNYKKLNELNKAISNYLEALKIAQDNSIHVQITEINAALGALYFLQGDADLAEDYFDSTIDESKKESLKKRAFITNSVANQYRYQQNFDKEIELKKQTLKELDDAKIKEVEKSEADEKITVQQLNLDIGNAYAKKKSYNEAIGYLEKSKTDAESVSDIATKKEAVQQLSEIYSNVGNFNMALSNYQEYVMLVDTLYKKREREIADAVALNKSLIEKQNRINSLEKDRELLESKYKLFESEEKVSEQSYKRQQQIIYSLLLGLLLLLATIYYMYKSNKQRKLSNNLLALKSLRSQMNPHFIFNALNSVNSFIAQNDERTANRYLTDFSQLMRNVLDNSEKDFIPLSKELDLLELYIKLEHSRFKDKFDYQIEIDKSLKVSDYMIPPMLLQPYVENAVWHGLRYKKNKGILKISFLPAENNSIAIVISDDGIGRKKSKELKTPHQQKSRSKAMDNIKKRVAILNEMYSDKVDVHISDLHSNSTGTKVVLTLKKD